MKALELADSIEDSLKYQIKYGRRISELERDIPIAAAELRRLAEVNAELLVALEIAKEQITGLCTEGDVPDCVNEAIAKAKEQQ